MLHDLPGVLGLAAVALFAAFLFVPRWLRRVAEPAGTAAVSPVRIPAAGGMAVPAVIVPPAVMTGPFAYDNGFTVEYAEEDGS